MQRIIYLIRRIWAMDFGAMLKTAKTLHKTTGKSTPWLLLDMVRCGLAYGAGYVDYKIAEMYRLTPSQRATQITRAVSNRIVARMNDKAYWHVFDDKAEFNTRFARHMGRAWLDVKKAAAAEVEAFGMRGDIIAKPMDGSSGQGICKYPKGSLPSREALLGEGIGLLEDCVVQHPALSALCPTSVNTVRVATLLGDKKQGIVYANLRIGNGGVVDNVDQGGMAAPIDLKTGKLSAVGADKQGNRYETHPLTGTKIPGFVLPYWEEVKAMCLAAMEEVPKVRFVAWDVAITEKGPLFIEGNSFPSHAVPQFAAHYPDGIGILPRFQEFIDL